MNVSIAVNIQLAAFSNYSTPKRKRRFRHPLRGERRRVGGSCYGREVEDHTSSTKT